MILLFWCWIFIVLKKKIISVGSRRWLSFLLCFFALKWFVWPHCDRNSKPCGYLKTRITRWGLEHWMMSLRNTDWKTSAWCWPCVKSRRSWVKWCFRVSCDGSKRSVPRWWFAVHWWTERLVWPPKSWAFPVWVCSPQQVQAVWPGRPKISWPRWDSPSNNAWSTERTTSPWMTVSSACILSALTTKKMMIEAKQNSKWPRLDITTFTESLEHDFDLYIVHACTVKLLSGVSATCGFYCIQEKAWQIMLLDNPFTIVSSIWGNKPSVCECGDWTSLQHVAVTVIYLEMAVRITCAQLWHCLKFKLEIWHQVFLLLLNCWM